MIFYICSSYSYLNRAVHQWSEDHSTDPRLNLANKRYNNS